jgi:uncharacterized membrane protein
VRTASAFLSALLLLSGCRTSPAGGGAGEGESFWIEVPFTSIDLKQGEAKVITVLLDRGGNFKRDVAMEFKAAAGISVEPAAASVKATGKPETVLRIVVPSGAALGSYDVEIKGTPDVGSATSIKIAVNVIAP